MGWQDANLRVAAATLAPATTRHAPPSNRSLKSNASLPPTPCPIKVISVETLCGSGRSGFLDNVPGPVAEFRAPHSAMILDDGSVLVSDSGNSCLRRVSSYAHHVGAIGSNMPILPKLSNPRGMCPFGSSLLVCDTGHNRIRKISLLDGIMVVDFAGSGARGFKEGTLETCKFDQPSGICLLPDGTLLVADAGNHRVRQIFPAERVVVTVAGTGHAGYADGDALLEAAFNFPTSVAFDPTDGGVLVSDSRNHCIRKISPDFRRVETVAGSPGRAGYSDGPAREARFDGPEGLAIGPGGWCLLADSDNNAVRALSPRRRHVLTLAGAKGWGSADGPPGRARFNCPRGLSASAEGDVVVCDSKNNLVRILRTAFVRILRTELLHFPEPQRSPPRAVEAAGPGAAGRSPPAPAPAPGARGDMSARSLQSDAWEEGGNSPATGTAPGVTTTSPGSDTALCFPRLTCHLLLLQVFFGDICGARHRPLRSAARVPRGHQRPDDTLMALDPGTLDGVPYDAAAPVPVHDEASPSPSSPSFRPPRDSDVFRAMDAVGGLGGPGSPQRLFLPAPPPPPAQPSSPGRDGAAPSPPFDPLGVRGRPSEEGRERADILQRMDADLEAVLARLRHSNAGLEAALGPGPDSAPLPALPEEPYPAGRPAGVPRVRCDLCWFDEYLAQWTYLAACEAEVAPADPERGAPAALRLFRPGLPRAFKIHGVDGSMRVVVKDPLFWWWNEGADSFGLRFYSPQDAFDLRAIVQGAIVSAAAAEGGVVGELGSAPGPAGPPRPSLSLVQRAGEGVGSAADALFAARRAAASASRPAAAPRPTSAPAPAVRKTARAAKPSGIPRPKSAAAARRAAARPPPQAAEDYDDDEEEEEAHEAAAAAPPPPMDLERAAREALRELKKEYGEEEEEEEDGGRGRAEGDEEGAGPQIPGGRGAGGDPYAKYEAVAPPGLKSPERAKGTPSKQREAVLSPGAAAKPSPRRGTAPASPAGPPAAAAAAAARKAAAGSPPQQQQQRTAVALRRGGPAAAASSASRSAAGTPERPPAAYASSAYASSAPASAARPAAPPSSSGPDARRLRDENQELQGLLHLAVSRLQGALDAPAAPAEPPQPQQSQQARSGVPSAPLDMNALRETRLHMMLRLSPAICGGIQAVPKYLSVVCGALAQGALYLQWSILDPESGRPAPVWGDRFVVPAGAPLALRLLLADKDRDLFRQRDVTRVVAYLGEDVTPVPLPETALVYEEEARACVLEVPLRAPAEGRYPETAPPPPPGASHDEGLDRWLSALPFAELRLRLHVFRSSWGPQPRALAAPLPVSLALCPTPDSARAYGPRLAARLAALSAPLPPALRPLAAETCRAAGSWSP
eukprot:tig00020629_g12405.t1